MILLIVFIHQLLCIENTKEQLPDMNFCHPLQESISSFRGLLPRRPPAYRFFVSGYATGLERIQRHAAIFITGDYRSREEESVSNMLVKLELQELKERRTSQKLICLYKVVEGLVPAIEPNDYLKKARPKRSITTRKNLRTTRQLTSSQNK